MLLQGAECRLRAVEEQDIDYIHRAENDPSVWEVSGTVAPYSRYSVGNFVAEQQAGIYATHQLRLMIERTADGRSNDSLVVQPPQCQLTRVAFRIFLIERSLQKSSHGKQQNTCGKNPRGNNTCRHPSSSPNDNQCLAYNFHISKDFILLHFSSICL